MADESATIFGIDLGTTFSAIAYVDEYGKPVVIPNADNTLVTPSVVYFESAHNIFTGQAARESGRVDPANCVELIKRSMGDLTYRRELHGTEYRPESLSAFILKQLKEDAERQLNHSVTDVVITVPAYFNEEQRTATEQAGQIAGLTVRGIIPEPTAAAIAYAATDGADQAILVYDLGGGTFDVTVMRVAGQKVRVVCVDGDHNLGGRNWDETVVAHLAGQWKAETGSADDPLDDPETMQELFKTAEEAKKLLTRLLKTPCRVSHAGHPVRVELTRDTFDNLTAPLLERTIQLTRQALAEADKLGTQSIDRILLVGGSSYMPQVQARLTTECPAVPQQLFEPEQAVAKGAAIYAANKQIQDAYAEALWGMFGRVDIQVEDLPIEQRMQLDVMVTRRLPGKSQEALDAGRQMQVINVCSKSFGVVSLDLNHQEEVTYLIRRNTPVPADVEETFGTDQANLSDVELRIIEAEGPLPPINPTDPACREIKKFILNLPPGLPENHPIRVRYTLSEDGGRLRVQATDDSSGRAIDNTVDTFNAITQQDLEQMQDQLASISLQS